MAHGHKIVILLAGNAGAGKDTLGAYLKEVLESRSFTVRQDAFAFTLKSFAHQAMGTPWDLLNGNKEIKEGTNFLVAGEDTGRTLRQGLQAIGEFFRQEFDKRVWANSLRLRALSAPEQVIVVTDCRHPDEEIDWMRETMGSVAKIAVVRIRNSRVPVKRGHPSEDHIADAPDSVFDFIVENDGTLEQLKHKAAGLAAAIMLK